MSYRNRSQERNVSGFVLNQINANGAMVLDSYIGSSTPKLNYSETDILLRHGNPDSTKYGVFEAITYARTAPLWTVSAIGAGAKYAGVDVQTSAVVPFGLRAGRTNPASIDYTTLTKNTINTLGTGNGITANFTGSLTNVPVTGGSLILYKAGTALNATESGGTITGTDISSGTLNLSNGAYNITLAGVAGTKAKFTSTIDLTATVDLSAIASSGSHDLVFSPPIVGATVPAIPTDTYSLSVNLNGGGATDVTFVVNVADSYTTIAATIATAIVGGSCAVSAGKLVFTSDAKGSASSIVIANGTTGTGGGFLTALAGQGITAVLGTPTNGKNAGFSLTIDETTHNIDLGAAVGTTRTTILAAINAAFAPSTVAVANNTGGQFIDFEGLIASATFGKVTITTSSLYENAVPTVISASATPISQTINSTDPTGAIPKYGQVLTADYLYVSDDSLLVSHSFLTVSPYDDAKRQLAVKITPGSGYQYTLILYEVVSGINTTIDTFTYSLIKEKNGFGKSLYIFDVFRDNEYIIPVVNSAYVGIAAPAISTQLLTGGSRGAAPLSSDYLAAWNNFQKRNKYYTKIFMDVYGNSATTLRTILQSYQPQAFGITCVPSGNSAANAVTFRQGLSIDYDNMAIYTNWATIEDPYNNSRAFISQIGAVGVKYAQMYDVYNSLQPAGDDENGHGGVLTGFKVLELEYDYTDQETGSELQTLDEAQINPIIMDEDGIIKIYGARTMYNGNRDTSFIGTRRLYNEIIETITKQILKRQNFKNNDRTHRLIAEVATREYLSPILANEYLREVVVVCDESNNTDTVLNAKQFILDIYVKATPDSEFVILRLTQVSQTQVIADFLKK